MVNSRFEKPRFRGAGLVRINFAIGYCPLGLKSIADQVPAAGSETSPLSMAGRRIFPSREQRTLLRNNTWSLVRQLQTV